MSGKIMLGTGSISRRELIAGALLVSAAGFPLNAQANELEDGRFRAEVIKLMRSERPKLHPLKGRDLKTIKLGDTEIYLGNIFAEVETLPENERRKSLLNFIDTFSAVAVDKLVSSSKQDLVKLRAQVAPTDFIGRIPGMVYSTLTATVVIASVLDEASSYRYVTKSDLKSWDIGEDAVRKRGTSNLDRNASKIPVEVRSSNDGVGRFAVFAEADGYTAARILCPHFMSRLHRAIGGKVYLAIPNRDFLGVWSEDFSGKVQFAALAAQDFASQSHPLTAEILVSEDGKLRAANAIERSAHARN